MYTPSHPLAIHPEPAGVWEITVAAEEWLHLPGSSLWRGVRHEPEGNLRLCGLLWDNAPFFAITGDRLHIGSSNRINPDANPLHSRDGDPSIEPARLYPLSPGFPNSFNACTHLWLMVPRGKRLRVHVVNLRGKLVYTLLEGMLEPGQHLSTRRGQDQAGATLASGLCVAQLEAAGLRLNRKALLIRRASVLLDLPEGTSCGAGCKALLSGPKRRPSKQARPAHWEVAAEDEARVSPVEKSPEAKPPRGSAHQEDGH